MERTRGRLDYSRYQPSGPVAALEEERILGEISEIVFARWWGRQIYRCINPSWLAVFDDGRLYLLGSEFFWTWPGRVAEIVYRSVDDRFGARGAEVTHAFGEEGGRLPRLRWFEHDIFVLAGGSYRVAPEGIRN